VGSRPHCTGEPAFAILKESFGDRYLYAGLGTTVLLGPKVTVKAEAGQPDKKAMDEEDIRSYREAMTQGPLRALLGGDRRQARVHSGRATRWPVQETAPNRALRRHFSLATSCAPALSRCSCPTTQCRAEASLHSQPTRSSCVTIRRWVRSIHSSDKSDDQTLVMADVGRKARLPLTV
jgi:hypothetical protein